MTREFKKKFFAQIMFPSRMSDKQKCYN